MVQALGVLDGLVRAFRGLVRMALQPQGPGEGDLRPIVAIVAEIDGAGLAGARALRHQGLELHAGAAMVARHVQRPAQNGMGQRDRRRILDGTGKGPALRRVLQRG